MKNSQHLPREPYWRDIVLQATAVEYIPAAAVVVVATPGHWHFLENRDWDLEAARSYAKEAGIEYIHNGGVSGCSIIAAKEMYRRKMAG